MFKCFGHQFPTDVEAASRFLNTLQVFNLPVKAATAIKTEATNFIVKPRF